MTKDPIIKKIRETRKIIEAECGNNSDKLFQHIKSVEKRYASRLFRKKSV
jgi:hypothetical protein